MRDLDVTIFDGVDVQIICLIKVAIKFIGITTAGFCLMYGSIGTFNPRANLLTATKLPLRFPAANICVIRSISNNRLGNPVRLSWCAVFSDLSFASASFVVNIVSESEATSKACTSE